VGGGGGGGGGGGSHYLAGFPPFDLETYLGWMRAAGTIAEIAE